MAKAIKVDNLSKAYQLGDFGTGTVSRDFERFLARLRGKEDPFLKIGEVNDRTKKGESDIVWSLKDINFEIEQGDAVGIIGRNGAGKSTLLKILSRITSPTTGSVKIKGRIASLLEVGTGFHPELSGRENIYLNGAILGMRKAEIKRKFDEIVNFSGVDRYIDTPVKRYSSGMYIRLAFAVAAHLESEILIVDEVLAVGDAEFQKKCLSKMDDVSKSEGRTVLFVSHNMAAVRNLCESVILLDKGGIVKSGSKENIIDYYYNEFQKRDEHLPINERKDRNGNGEVRIIDFDYELDDNLKFSLRYVNQANNKFKGKIYIAVYDLFDNCVMFLDSNVISNAPTWFEPSGNVCINLANQVALTPGTYKVNIAILVEDKWVDHLEAAITMYIEENDFYKSGKTLYHKPMIHVDQKWDFF